MGFSPPKIGWAALLAAADGWDLKDGALPQTWSLLGWHWSVVLMGFLENGVFTSQNRLGRFDGYSKESKINSKENRRYSRKKISILLMGFLDEEEDKWKQKKMNDKKKRKRYFKKGSGAHMAGTNLEKNKMLSALPAFRELKCEAISPAFKKLICEAN